MSDTSESHVVKMPNLLRAKLGTKPGPSLDEIVAEAEAALDDMQTQYEVWIRDYLTSLNDALAKARAMPTPSPETIDQIRVQAHEIKGQGATFGYPLLTTLGHMLHRLIDLNRAAAARNLDLIGAHVDFMNLVVKDEIRDQGGLTEAELLKALEAASQKVLGGQAG